MFNIFKKDLSLKAKSIISFGFIFFLVIALFVVAYNTINQLNEGYTEIVDKDYKNIEILEKQEISKLSLRRHEKDFLLRRSDKYIIKHDKEYKNLANLFQELEQNTNASDKPTIDLIKEKAQAYKLGFKQLVSLYAMEGDSKTGIRGKLRITAHNMETFINESGLSSYYMIELLTFRRREKDYLLRRDNEYYGKLLADIKRVHLRMDEKNLDNSRKTEFKNLIDKYRNQFILMTKNYENINTTKAIFRKDVHALEEAIVGLIDKKKDNLLRVQEELRHDSKVSIRIFFGVTAAILVLILLINFIAYRVTNNLSRMVDKIKGLAENFLVTSGMINTSSTSLDDLATNQASAIQETASSVNEITAMVSKNADNAINSQEKSKENAKAANKGKDTVFNVIKAMNSLSESTRAITTRFNKTSDELQDVVGIINQIGEKAQVINDIVFQTKLLSFNASVEAARAGEHGKGFAVVAEEIGNLASMSGSSAEEIAQILEESVRKVNNLVDSNQSEIKTLVSSNTERVNHGIETAKECEVALNIIINNVDDITTSISEIAHASQEQDTGVKEISQAINEFNSSNQQAVSLANDSKKHSSEIKDKADVIFEMTEDLEKLLYGHANNTDYKKTA